jgi:hypothetical protein
VGGGQVGAEWLLDDDEPPSRGAHRPLGLLDGRGHRGGVGGFRAGERERLLECLPGRSYVLADPEFGDRLAGKVAELLVGQVSAGRPVI